jgi:hypothetical protein
MPKTRPEGRTMDRIFDKVTILAGLALLASGCFGQTASTASTGTVSQGNLTPSDYRKMLALGQRLYTPGKERIAYTGSLTLPGGTPTPTRVTLQLPNQLRIDLASGQPLLYDGVNFTPASFSQGDAGTLLQMFYEDSAESYLIERSKGMGKRLISQASNIIDNLDVDGEVTNCEASQAPYPRQFGVNQRTTKMYCFDLTNNWLAYSFSTFSSSGQPVHRTIVFRNWTQVSNDYYPFRIVVRDNGAVTYQFTAATAVVSAQANDGVFPSN